MIQTVLINHLACDGAEKRAAWDRDEWALEPGQGDRMAGRAGFYVD